VTDHLALTWGVLFHHLRRRAVLAARDERGEGVISAAIAVLIVAFLGAAMWVAFNSIWSDSEERIRTSVESIGQ
jgi:hypothetical protein